MAMNDGSPLSQPNVDDLRPTRTLYLHLLSTVMLWALIAICLVRVGGSELAFGMCFTTGLIGTLMFLGDRKLWTDWRDRTWRGNYLQMYLNGDGTPKSHFVNKKDRAHVVVSGWSLYVPVGGWFTRPYICHQVTGRPKYFRLVRVTWLLTKSDVGKVVVVDWSGNRMNLHWADFLRDLELLLPDGERAIGYSNIFRAIQRAHEDRLNMEVRKAHAETDRATAELTQTQLYLATFRSTVLLALSRLDTIESAIGTSSRLKTTKEGERFRGHLASLRSEVEGMTYIARQFTTEAGHSLFHRTFI